MKNPAFKGINRILRRRSLLWILSPLTAPPPILQGRRLDELLRDHERETDVFEDHLNGKNIKRSRSEGTYGILSCCQLWKCFETLCLVGTRSSSLLKKNMFFPVFQSFRVYLQFVWKVRSKTHPIPEKQVPCFNMSMVQLLWWFTLCQRINIWYISLRTFMWCFMVKW